MWEHKQEGGAEGGDTDSLEQSTGCWQVPRPRDLDLNLERTLHPPRRTPVQGVYDGRARAVGEATVFSKVAEVR